ncbi:WD repeat-containing protein CG11141-like isoform X1 [Dinothrombium tinctorium]|uniref:WD repeat-containing protein CG11141-like isoform X1 n=1 Tax=Dinothrombium tinctorium TaxID=1965070 RepID=A0A443QPS9_9ACAR|nr:WD repeat-containing protein CG11141-like isoform X1 [Dinothrombium tinctorium]
MNEKIFSVDCFHFLRDSIPAKVESGINLLSQASQLLTVTCFDINCETIVFGTDCGLIYGFRRGEKASRRAHFRMAPVSTKIDRIKLSSSNLLAFNSVNHLIVYKFDTLEMVYIWKNVFDDGKAINITTINSVLDRECAIYVFTGDQLGCVWRHDLTQSKQQLVFQEAENTGESRHFHEIVQIDCCDNETILVSTCFRSVIVKIKSDCDYEVIQIGKNARKVCGKYGAVFAADHLFAARPSLHLIKANKFDGNVIETFMLKKAKEPFPLPELSEFRSFKLPQKQQLPQLGSMIAFTVEDKGINFLISWNETSIMIISPDGQLLLKESQLNDLIDVKISPVFNFVDIFLLFKSRDFLRLRHKWCDTKDIAALHESENISKSDTKAEDQESVDIASRDSRATEYIEPIVESIFPFTNQAIEQIGELKKIFFKFQSKFIGDNSSEVDLDSNASVKSHDSNKTSNSDCSESDLKEDMRKTKVESDILNEPLVVHKKLRKSKRKIKNNDIKENNSKAYHFRKTSTASSDIASVISDASSTTSSHSSEKCLKNESNKIIECKTAENGHKENRTYNSDMESRLSHILHAFREGLSEELSADVNGSEIHSENLKSTDDLIEDFVENELHSIGNVKEEIFHEFEAEYEIKSESDYSTVDIDWNLVLEGSFNVNKIKILSLCAASYDDQIGVGYVWLSCLINKQTALYYLPSFKNIKCPQNKTRIVSLGVNTKHILVLYEDGNLYCRRGDSTKPVAEKWISIDINRPQCKLTSLSVNDSDSVVWCCDLKGKAWLLKLSPITLVPIRDDSDSPIYFKSIVVSPQDSSVVWALSIDDKLFARCGIFNENGIKDELIGGISWIRVTTPILPKSIAATTRSIWFSNEEGDRIFRRVGMDPPFDCIGQSWEEVKCPTLINDCIKQLSASLNDDIWLLTKCGSVWQYCNHPQNTLQEVESDWILVK